MSLAKRNVLRIVNFALSALLIAVAVWLFINRQYVQDQITVWQFKPAPGVVGLVDRAGMNDNGKFYYLASQPKLDGTQNFNDECDKIEDSTSILGCYSNMKIYVYDVTDPKLDGIKEVTAAHETLHAIYARLSSAERSLVNKLLEDEYLKLEKQADFKQRMAFYARTEPTERDNELHSIIGTEVKDISPQLEEWYAKYFNDRQKVLALNDSYGTVFRRLSDKAKDLSAQISTLSASISAETTSYNRAVAQLNVDIEKFNNTKYKSESQFYSDRQKLMDRISVLDDERQKINADITNYQKLIEQYNAIATESKKLYNSIDSTLAPAPSV